MALMRVMTLCLLVYAALEYRIRQALQQHDQTFPNQKGQPIRTLSVRRCKGILMAAIPVKAQSFSVVRTVLSGNALALQPRVVQTSQLGERLACDVIQKLRNL